jgi:hypothetical protein
MAYAVTECPNPALPLRLMLRISKRFPLDNRRSVGYWVRFMTARNLPTKGTELIEWLRDRGYLQHAIRRRSYHGTGTVATVRRTEFITT